MLKPPPGGCIQNSYWGVSPVSHPALAVQVTVVPGDAPCGLADRVVDSHTACSLRPTSSAGALAQPNNTRVETSAVATHLHPLRTLAMETSSERTAPGCSCCAGTAEHSFVADRADG